MVRVFAPLAEDLGSNHSDVTFCSPDRHASVESALDLTSILAHFSAGFNPRRDETPRVWKKRPLWGMIFEPLISLLGNRCVRSTRARHRGEPKHASCCCDDRLAGFPETFGLRSCAPA